MVIDMSELTIGEMIERVPEGQLRVFEPAVRNGYEEQYFQVRQSWDYQPDRLEWHNPPPLLEAPWLGSRRKSRATLETLPAPDVMFGGPSKEVVDLYSTSGHVFFISDALFRLVVGIDPDSLEHLEFRVRASDAELSFHAVMPRRVLEAVDTRRTKVLIKYTAVGSAYRRSVEFPEGIVFDNDKLRGVTSFTDIDAPGWYWSKDLIELAKAQGMRGLYAESVDSNPAQVIARM